MRAKKIVPQEVQLSLFEEPIESKPPEKPSVLELVRARFEYGPEMTPEEYKRWIKILVNNSIKGME